MSPKSENLSLNRAKNKESRYTVKEPTELMKFLIEIYHGKSRTGVKSLLANRQVFVDDLNITKFDYPLNPGQVVSVNSEKAPKSVQLKGLKILFEDEHVIVINKSEGLLSMASEKDRENNAYRILSDYIKEFDPSSKIFIIHRLDRETSGVMIFAKSEDAKRVMQSDWQEEVLERKYVVVVEGVPEKKEGTITSWLVESGNFIVYSNRDDRHGGQKAITHYKVLNTNGRYSLVEVLLETGRKNQIRVHMQDLGHPVIGDKKYGATHTPLNRLGLHAHVLIFKHPITRKVMRFETPIPDVFKKMFTKQD